MLKSDRLLGRGDAFAAILGNLNQSVFAEPAYSTIERKAAHLLYFVIKNHLQAEVGNKRTGASLFVGVLSTIKNHAHWGNW